MDAILSSASQPPLLRSGFQAAIAAGENECQAAAQLELMSILEGAAFRGSERSAAFLRYVVEETLAGRHSLLKERTIGAAVLGKDPGYDTGSDSGVRVRASEVRKRLASHYDLAAPRAGIRIELPAGSYVPSFVTVGTAEPAVTPPVSRGAPVLEPPPMQLWQLAAPCVISLFLALVAIRGGVETNNSFSRFWNHALAGRTAISIAVDADGRGSISPAIADAAMPLEALANIFQVPVHIVAAEAGPAAGSCVIRMSLREKPKEPVLISLDGATVYRGRGGVRLWLWADSTEKLRSAAQALASRSEFPEIE
jgi:hypothetical protein